MLGGIYIAYNTRDKGKDLFKVGITKNFKNRLESLNTSGVVGNIEYLETFPLDNGLEVLEKKIHHEISRKYPREKGKEWFHCPSEIIIEIIKKVINPSNNLKIDMEHLNNEIFQFLINDPNLDLVKISLFANQHNWPCHIGLGLTPYHNWERAFYILANKELEINNKNLFKYLRLRGSLYENNLKEFPDYCNFLQDLQNKIRKTNLRRYINETSFYFQPNRNNLKHLGMAIWLLEPLEKINKVLTIEWGSQIKQILNNNNIVWREGYLRYSDLEIMEKFLEGRRDNRI